MDSFYGGQPGTPFVIKTSFESTSAMEEAFEQDSNYTTVWYGEYCIIDTPNKNDSENGQIYRRGTTGGEYIGQIVGPASGTPLIEVATPTDDDVFGVKTAVNNKIAKYDDFTNYSPNVYYRNAEKKLVNKTLTSAADTIEDLYTEKFTVDSHNLIAGNDENGGDQIQWQWVNFRSLDSENDSFMYVGFTMPYNVIKFTSTTVDPYKDSQPTEILKDNKEENRRPFYQEWDLKIPKGVKGDSLNNIVIYKAKTEGSNYNLVPVNNEIASTIEKVIIKNSDGEFTLGDVRIYRPTAFVGEYDKKTGTTYTTSISSKEEDYLSADELKYLFEKENSVEEQDNESRQIIIYTTEIYDEEIVQKYYIYLGNYNNIANVRIEDDGTLHFDYTYDNSYIKEHAITTITGISLDTETGIFTITLNNDSLDGTEEYSETLHLPKEVKYDDSTGLVSYTYTNGINEDNEPNDITKTLNNGTPIQYIKEINYCTPKEGEEKGGTITFKYNLSDKNDDSYQLLFPYEVNNTDADLTFTFSNDTKTTFKNSLEKVEKAGITDNGIISFYTNGKDDQGEYKSFSLKEKAQNGTVTNNNFQLKYIKSIGLIGTGINDDKNLQVEYNTGPETIGDSAINGIEDVRIITDPVSGNSSSSLKNLYILYSDKSKRYTGKKTYDDDGSLASTTYPDEDTDNKGYIWTAAYLVNPNEYATYRNNIKYPKDGYQNVYYRNFGSVRDTSGILVGLEITNDIIQSDKDVQEKDIFKNADYTSKIDDNLIIEYLNYKYPQSYDDGKVAIYTPPIASDNGDVLRIFYGFDSTVKDKAYKGWFKIGSLADSSMRDIILYQNHGTVSNNLPFLNMDISIPNTSEDGMLNKNGIGLVQFNTPNIPKDQDPLPTPWILIPQDNKSQGGY
jgi:hypothetical protein